MPLFLHQAAYTTEAWRAMINNPQDRTEIIRPAIEKLGGRVVNVYFAFGEYDVLAITEFPTNVSAAAIAIAFAGGGALKALRTTPLLSTQEMLEATKKAATSGYRSLIAGAAASA